MDAKQQLSLADLHKADPQHPQGKTERDCCCPFCGDGKRLGPTNRTLGYNAQTGAWVCHRCHQKGILTDFQTAPLPTRPTRARRHLQQIAALPPAVTEKPADVDSEDWPQIVRGLKPLPDTPGAAYLASRGIPFEIAVRSGVRYHPSFYGRAAVVFPVRDLAGELTACNARYIDGKVDANGNKHLSGRTCNRFEGGLKRGVFSTPGAWDAPHIVIVEAPIDALSLHAAGVPSLALCGVTVREWMRARLAWRTVHLGFDNDPVNAQGKQPGEEAFFAWEATLTPYGVCVNRLRPVGVKDWNDALRMYGVDAMRQAFAVAFEDVAAPPAPPNAPAPFSPPAASRLPAPSEPLETNALPAEPSLSALSADTEATPDLPAENADPALSRALLRLLANGKRLLVGTPLWEMGKQGFSEEQTESALAVLVARGEIVHHPGKTRALDAYQRCA